MLLKLNFADCAHLPKVSVEQLFVTFAPQRLKTPTTFVPAEALLHDENMREITSGISAHSGSGRTNGSCVCVRVFVICMGKILQPNDTYHVQENGWQTDASGLQYNIVEAGYDHFCKITVRLCGRRYSRCRCSGRERSHSPSIKYLFITAVRTHTRAQAQPSLPRSVFLQNAIVHFFNCRVAA